MIYIVSEYASQGEIFGKQTEFKQGCHLQTYGSFYDFVIRTSFQKSKNFRGIFKSNKFETNILQIKYNVVDIILKKYRIKIGTRELRKIKMLLRFVQSNYPTLQIDTN